MNKDFNLVVVNKIINELEKEDNKNKFYNSLTRIGVKSLESEDIKTIMSSQLLIALKVCQKIKELNYIKDLFPKEDLEIINDLMNIPYLENRNSFITFNDNKKVAYFYHPVLKQTYLRTIKNKIASFDALLLFSRSSEVERELNKDISEFSSIELANVFRACNIKAPENLKLMNVVVSNYRKFVVEYINSFTVRQDKVDFSLLVEDEQFEKIALKDTKELLNAIDNIYKENGYLTGNINIKIFLYLLSIGFKAEEIFLIKEDGIDLNNNTVRSEGREDKIRFPEEYKYLFEEVLNSKFLTSIEAGYDKIDSKTNGVFFLEESDYIIKRKNNFKLQTFNKRTLYNVVIKELVLIRELQKALPESNPYKYKTIDITAAERLYENEVIDNIYHSSTEVRYVRKEIADTLNCCRQSAYNKFDYYIKHAMVFNPLRDIEK